MIAHFIQRKGKGGWVLATPLVISLLLFIIADAFSLNDRYIGPITLVFSGIILFLIDNKRESIVEGDIIQRTVKLARIKKKNTFYWIEVRYWAMLMIAIGIIWLLN